MLLQVLPLLLVVFVILFFVLLYLHLTSLPKNSNNINATAITTQKTEEDLFKGINDLLEWIGRNNQLAVNTLASKKKDNDFINLLISAYSSIPIPYDKNDYRPSVLIEVLIQIGEPAIDPLLNALLTGPRTWNVAESVLPVYGDRILPSLLELLENGERADIIVRTIGNINTNASRTSIVSLLFHNNPYVRSEAVTWLAIIDAQKTPDITRTVIKAFEVENPTNIVPSELLEEICSRLQENAVPIILRAVNSPNKFKRSQAAFALSRFKQFNSQALNTLSRLLLDDDTIVRSTALSALRGHNFDKDQLELIYKKYQNGNLIEKSRALVLFPVTGESKYFDSIIGALIGSSSTLRYAAVESLGAYCEIYREQKRELHSIIDKIAINEMVYTPFLSTLDKYQERNKSSNRRPVFHWWELIGSDEWLQTYTDDQNDNASVDNELFSHDTIESCFDLIRTRTAVILGHLYNSRPISKYWRERIDKYRNQHICDDNQEPVFDDDDDDDETTFTAFRAPTGKEELLPSISLSFYLDYKCKR